jgi:hypothetical protein
VRLTDEDMLHLMGGIDDKYIQELLDEDTDIIVDSSRSSENAASGTVYDENSDDNLQKDRGAEIRTFEGYSDHSGVRQTERSEERCIKRRRIRYMVSLTVAAAAVLIAFIALKKDGSYDSASYMDKDSGAFVANGTEEANETEQTDTEAESMEEEKQMQVFDNATDEAESVIETEIQELGIRAKYSDASKTGMTLKFSRDSSLPGEAELTGEYLIERETADGWESIGIAEEIKETSAGARTMLKENTETDVRISWKETCGTLEEGTYRVIASVLEEGNDEIYRLSISFAVR